MLSADARRAVEAETARIDKARGGCIAVSVTAINGDPGNLEAQIDPEKAKYCRCKYCRSGDLTTSA